jgi:tripeptide aminopeptidase
MILFPYFCIMEKEKINQLIDILSIPSYFGMEYKVMEYLINHAKNEGYFYYQDEKGNLYFEKGKLDEGEYFPCVCAHTDTVFKEHIELITSNKNKDVRFGKKKTNNTKLFAYLPGTDIRTGLGGDDLAGVFICLQMMKSFEKIKAVFFVEEEYGCQGSRSCDDLFFNDVGYVIQFDGPTGNWFTKTLGGIEMYSEDDHKIIKPILEKYNVSKYSDDPYTDILPLKEKFDFSCFNLPTGYFNWHTKQEYVDIRYVEKGINIGKEFIETLGNKFHKFEYIDKDDYLFDDDFFDLYK